MRPLETDSRPHWAFPHSVKQNSTQFISFESNDYLYLSLICFSFLALLYGGAGCEWVITNRFPNGCHGISSHLDYHQGKIQGGMTFKSGNASESESTWNKASLCLTCTENCLLSWFKGQKKLTLLNLNRKCKLKHFMISQQIISSRHIHPSHHRHRVFQRTGYLDTCHKTETTK